MKGFSNLEISRSWYSIPFKWDSKGRSVCIYMCCIPSLTRRYIVTLQFPFLNRYAKSDKYAELLQKDEEISLAQICRVTETPLHR